jgi:hypothetical protein
MRKKLKKGRVFGWLTVLSDEGWDKISVVCKCGKIKFSDTHSLKTGRARSCGCFKNTVNNLVTLIPGRKYGRLKIIKGVYRYKSLAECDCGLKKKICSWAIKSGRIKSCGCLQKELLFKRLKHGHTKSNKKSIEYYTYWNMRKRCLNKNQDHFEAYGGRGITICKRWLGKNGFQNFLKDMGNRPSLEYSLDRKNNDGNYTKSNCRWATRSQQMHNRRSKNKTGFRGVRIMPNGKFHAEISGYGKRFYLGIFKSKKDASKAYNDKAKELFSDKS